MAGVAITAWKTTDVMLKCDQCGKEIQIDAGKTVIIEDASIYTSGGWRYIGHTDGTYQIWTRSLSRPRWGRFKLKSRSLMTLAIAAYIAVPNNGGIQNDKKEK